tara:strand:- start:129 stop:317 length:189 start_codon:yes stop_codon:yes gene_type:complete
MFNNNTFNYGEIGNVIQEGKGQCSDTSCIRDLVDFLQEQMELLEEECYERDNDLQKAYNEDE